MNQSNNNQIGCGSAVFICIALIIVTIMSSVTYTVHLYDDRLVEKGYGRHILNGKSIEFELIPKSELNQTTPPPLEGTWQFVTNDGSVYVLNEHNNEYSITNKSN